MFPQITQRCTTLSQQFEIISEDRKVILNRLAQYITEQLKASKLINLVYICTHNSPRSHFGQVWASVAAHYYSIPSVSTYSGGTEATALFPMVAETLKKSGFQIFTLSKGENPVYSIKYAANEAPVIGFSKKYDDDFNPNSQFAAIMTCSQADGGCPFIAGAEKRIPITFEDPKVFDNTPQQAEKYLERSNQIATEMMHVFSQITK